MIDQLRTKVGDDIIPVKLGDITTARVDGKFNLVFGRETGAVAARRSIRVAA